MSDSLQNVSDGLLVFGLLGVIIGGMLTVTVGSEGVVGPSFTVFNLVLLVAAVYFRNPGDRWSPHLSHLAVWLAIAFLASSGMYMWRPLAPSPLMCDEKLAMIQDRYCDRYVHRPPPAYNITVPPVLSRTPMETGNGTGWWNTTCTEESCPVMVRNRSVVYYIGDGTEKLMFKLSVTGYADGATRDCLEVRERTTCPVDEASG